MTRKSVTRKTRRTADRVAKAVNSPANRAKLSRAAKALEKAAATYAKRASEAGVAAGKSIKRLSKTRTGKILAAAALAAAGFAARKVIRGK